MKDRGFRVRAIAILFLILGTSPAARAVARNGTQMISVHGSSGLSATLTYRLKPSRFAGSEADTGPVIASGDVTLRRSNLILGIIPLSALGMVNEYQTFGQEKYGCGVGAEISFQPSQPHPTYIALESIAVGKGCAPLIHLIETSTLKVIPESSIDHPYGHRFDPFPSTFRVKEMVSISKSECFPVPSYPATGKDGRALWHVCVLRMSSANGQSKVVFMQNVSAPDLPETNERVAVGTISAVTVIRLSAIHEKRWLQRRKPLSRRAIRSMRYNQYIERFRGFADQGKFAESLSAYKTALANLDDDDLRDRESMAIPKMQRILKNYRSGKLTLSAVKHLWIDL